MGKGDKNHKRRKPGKRTASGQPSRSQEARAARKAHDDRVAFEQDPRQVVLQARKRHMGKTCTGPVTKDEAKRLALFDRGTPLGDWMADGYLTRGHVEVAGDYAARHARYRTLCGLPKPTPQIGAYGAVRGQGGDVDPDAARQARVAHMADQAALQKCTAGTRWAMHRACIAQDAAPLHLVREGIEALAALHGVDLDRPAKKAA